MACKALNYQLFVQLSETVIKSLGLAGSQKESVIREVFQKRLVQVRLGHYFTWSRPCIDTHNALSVIAQSALRKGLLKCPLHEHAACSATTPDKKLWKGKRSTAGLMIGSCDKVCWPFCHQSVPARKNCPWDVRVEMAAGMGAEGEEGGGSNKWMNRRETDTWMCFSIEEKKKKKVTM